MYKLPSLHKAGIIPSKTLKYQYWMTLEITVQVLHNNYIMIIIQWNTPSSFITR